MPEAPTRCRFQARDVVGVVGVPGHAEPVEGVVTAPEAPDGVAYVRLEGGCAYPVDVIRLTLVTPAEDLVRG